MGLSDRECAALLAWAAPRLGLNDLGFSRVREQVRKRIARRIQELGLPDAAVYRSRLSGDPGEWEILDSLCRVTISRFWRDAPAFDHLTGTTIPALARRARERGAASLKVWSAACASGEEPYSIALAWHVRLAARFPDLSLDLIASDASAHLLDRAARAEYPASIFRELPSDLRAPLELPSSSRALVTVPARFRHGVRFAQVDIRASAPPGPFDLILCRNLVFTYFDAPLQARLLAELHALLVPHGALMIGKREALPDSILAWESRAKPLGIVEKL